MLKTNEKFSLTCGHCRSAFDASYKQHWRATRQGTDVYCSPACRHAAIANKLRTPVPNRGPCLTCGKTFFSRRDAKFCSLQCYTNSRQFRAMVERNRRSFVPHRRTKTGVEIPCPECGVLVYRKPFDIARKRRFCSTVCYRSYMAQRFDRWIAHPEGMALPQAYDAFLDRDVLPCPIDNCGWLGKHLTLHANQVHGLKADELKRAMGFNLGSGLVSRPLAIAYQSRPLVGVALDPPCTGYIPQPAVRYRSLEAAEHQKKARALMGKGPQRLCLGCGILFEQSTPMGAAKYCSIPCRTAHYSQRKRKNAKMRSRTERGTFQWT